MKEESIMISKATIDRLPLYFRALRLMQREEVEIVSSEELGKRLGITPEQIRKDLASFGQFGKKGVGYYVRELLRNIGDILGLHYNWNFAIVGVGHLGWALSNYRNFTSLGFNFAAIFDVDPDKIGLHINGAQVFHVNEMEKIVREKNIHIGIIAVPEAHAQAVADKLVASGIRGIWNFAPRKITVPNSVYIINEDLSVGLSSLSYYLSRRITK
ncbi:hypothetical protein P22_0039 [Propionispora sp. 2/2-37]|nr:redox-sensing transcriptional repressor Rex [Propionispora sp. 2/2-37]CUH93977.1 hypothetical protein P22_0039 [Propionispora sp. 2/2-37]